MKNSLEIFAKESKFPVSQNVTEIIEQVKTVREQLIDLFKKLCLDDAVYNSEMEIKYDKNQGDSYFIKQLKNGYRDYITIPHENRIDLFTNYFIIKEKISLCQVEKVIDYGFEQNTITVDKSEFELTGFKKFLKFFGSKFTKEVVENKFNIKKETEYSIDSFGVKKTISSDEFEILSYFFKEQKIRKETQDRVNQFKEFKQFFDNDNNDKFESSQLS